ncbi:MAG: hypothetical protein U0531_00815 [Dehalococcoidia bacterium]
MIGESMLIALHALAANKLRTLLTMLGIVIGVGAVIAAARHRPGPRPPWPNSYASLGTNVISVVAGSMSVGGVRSYRLDPGAHHRRRRRRRRARRAGVLAVALSATSLVK